MYLNSSNALTWVTGAENASPSPPDFPGSGTPICYVYCKTTMTKIVNYEDSGSNPNEGYIYRDIRPVFSIVTPKRTILFHIPGDMETGDQKFNVRIPCAGIITRAEARIDTAPVGADLIFDININGVTIWTAQGDRVKIIDGSANGNQISFDVTSLAAGDILTVDIDQIGVATPGADTDLHLEFMPL